MAVDNFLVEIILLIVGIVIVLFLIFYFWGGGKDLFLKYVPNSSQIVNIATPSIIRIKKSKRSDTTSFFIYLLIALVIIILGIFIYLYFFNAIKSNNPVSIANNITQNITYP